MELLKGDSNRILQVIMNLVSNAIKFTSKGYVNILLSVSNSSSHITSPQVSNSRYLEIFVEDTGSGMSEDEISQLFKTRFYQPKSQSNKQGSSGLGLNISYKLVELMKGSLEVESLKDKGSKFTVKIPCLSVNEKEKDEFTQSFHPVNSSLNHYPPLIHILIVDDNEINRRVLMVMLNKEGYKCETANDGEEAISKFLNSLPPYDLILMDTEMPKLDGHEATKRIREYEKEQKIEQRIPILCVSGNTGEEFENKVIKEGFDDCITKPFQRVNMIEKIHNLLDSSTRITTLPNSKKRGLDEIESEDQSTQQPPPKKRDTN